MTAGKRFRNVAAFVVILLALGGCSDDGKKSTEPDPPQEQNEPAIDRLIPTRTVIGDTVTVEGSDFGATQDAGFLEFARAGGGGVEATILSWGDTEIRALIPDEASTGKVSILQPGEIQSNEVDFTVAPRLVTFTADLIPLFQTKGCASCHGGSGGYFVNTRATTIAGGGHGPAVIPRKSSESILYRKVSLDPPFGDRMPLGCQTGGTCLTAGELLLVADWIDQGARDN